ncbi:hypothetical protein NBE98_00960 [Clostridium swellfunianum]|nr:hypothetical protein [Clostridium swellfunianum]
MMDELTIKENLSPELYCELKMLLNNISTISSNTKVHFIKSSGEICFIYTLDKNNLNSIRNIEIYGLFASSINQFKSLEDYLYMEVGIKLQASGTPLEIKTINAGKLKRCGRGSQGIRFLEEILIPEINEILHHYNYTENIKYIYGISAELSPETNSLARAKFYSKNGFIMSNCHFYKYL